MRFVKRFFNALRSAARGAAVAAVGLVLPAVLPAQEAKPGGGDRPTASRVEVKPVDIKQAMQLVSGQLKKNTEVLDAFAQQVRRYGETLGNCAAAAGEAKRAYEQNPTEENGAQLTVKIAEGAKTGAETSESLARGAGEVGAAAEALKKEAAGTLAGIATSLDRARKNVAEARDERQRIEQDVENTDRQMRERGYLGPAHVDKPLPPELKRALRRLRVDHRQAATTEAARTAEAAQLGQCQESLQASIRNYDDIKDCAEDLAYEAKANASCFRLIASVQVTVLPATAQSWAHAKSSELLQRLREGRDQMAQASQAMTRLTQLAQNGGTTGPAGNPPDESDKELLAWVQSLRQARTQGAAAQTPVGGSR